VGAAGLSEKTVYHITEVVPETGATVEISQSEYTDVLAIREAAISLDSAERLFFDCLQFLP
jgi:hypothetical protein